MNLNNFSGAMICIHACLKKRKPIVFFEWYPHGKTRGIHLGASQSFMVSLHISKVKLNAEGYLSIARSALGQCGGLETRPIFCSKMYHYPGFDRF